jgi:hypothetical protein
MSAIATTHDRPVSATDVVRLQFANPNRTLAVPLYILGGVVLLTVAISIAILRAGGTLDGADFNASVLWSVTGYTVAIGVQNVSASFPFALALGSTRRAFVLGNLASAFAQAAVVAVVAVLLLGLEHLTGGWFIGARALGTELLGDGNPAVLGGLMLLTVLTALSVGGVFAAAWVRFGARGPLVLTLALAALGVLVLLLLLPQLTTFFAGFEPWWLAAAGAALIGLSLVGQYLFLRRAGIR